MEKSLIIKYRWHDTDVVEVSVLAWNGRFAGQTNLYVGQGDLETISKQLAGFPEKPLDRREVVLGAFGSQCAGGALKLRFFQRDLADHVLVDLEMEADQQGSIDAEKVTLLSNIEPASLNRFVPELLAMSSNLCGSAELKFMEA
jgi:hypothetical protein